jgi:gas vesicle protein
MTRTKWPGTIAGVVLVVGIGIALGVLFAPQAGEETRDYLAGAAKDRLKNARGGARKALNKGRQFIEQAQDTLQKTEGQIKEQINEVVREGESSYREARNAG